MAKLTQTPQATVTTTQTVTLSTALRKRLLLEFKAYEKLALQRRALTEEMDALKDSIQALREKTGEKGLMLDGYRTKLVEPHRSVLNKKAMVRDDVVTMAQFAQYTETKPSRPYEKITLPGEKDEDPREDE